MKKSNRSNAPHRQQPTWLKGDPALRQQIQQWIPLITVLIIAGFAWVIHRLRSFDEVPGNPCVAAAELSQLLTTSGMIASALLGFIALLLFWFSFNSFKEAAFPPSVMPVVRDTMLRTGSDAKVRAAVLAAIGLLVVSCAAYGYWRVMQLVAALQVGC